MLIKKLLNKETVIESVSLVTAFILLERIIQIGRGIIFARLLGPSEYGVYTLAFFFIPLVVTFAKLGIPACYERYVPQYEKRGELSNFFIKNYFLILLAGIFITLLCLIFSGHLSIFIYASTKYENIVVMCALTVFFYNLYENFLYSFNGLRIFKMGVLLRFTQFIIYTVIGISLVLFYPKAESTIFANLISYILVSIIFGYIIWQCIINSKDQKLRIKEDKFYGKMFKYSVWFIITPVVFTLFKYTDRWMINRFLGLHEVGVYSVASNITSILFMFGMITGNVLLPNLSKIWENNQREKAIFMLNFATKISTTILFLSAVFLVLTKKQIVSILYGAEYLEGLPLIATLSVFWLFNSIFWTIKGYSGLVEKTYIPFISVTIGLLLNVVLNYALIPQYKIMGAAVATTIAFGVNLIIVFAINNKEGMRVELRTVVICLLPIILFLDYRTMIFILILLLGVILCTNFIITKHDKILFYELAKKRIRSKNFEKYN